MTATAGRPGPDPGGRAGPSATRALPADSARRCRCEGSPLRPAVPNRDPAFGTATKGIDMTVPTRALRPAELSADDGDRPVLRIGPEEGDAVEQALHAAGGGQGGWLGAGELGADLQFAVGLAH